MKTFAKLLRFFKGEPLTRPPLSTGNIEADAVHDTLTREVELLGEERSRRQRYYEDWACRESWLVRDEALPLLTSNAVDTVDVDESRSRDGEDKEHLESLWEHVRHCVERGLSPAILNPADPPELWRAEPVELYRWAVAARLSMPEELEALLAFISSAVKRGMSATGKVGQSCPDDTEEGSADIYLAREQILDAMLSLALREILNAQSVDADRLRKSILDQLYDSAEFLFEQQEPPLTRPAVHDLFDRSLEKAINR